MINNHLKKMAAINYSSKKNRLNITSFFTVVPIQTKKPHGFNVTWVLSAAIIGQYSIIV